MITEKKIKEIVDDCKKKGFSVKVRDIAYVLLCERIEDHKIVYMTLFGEAPKNIKNLDNSPQITYLRDYMKYSMKDDKINGVMRVSFEENRDSMIELLKQTQTAMDNGEIDKKDGLKILTDIRVKLNDKFNVSDNSQNSFVVVEPKFNSICECGREIYVPTKEDLMRQYDLIEK